MSINITVVHHLVLLQKELVRMVHLLLGRMLPCQHEIFKRINAIKESILLVIEGLVATLKVGDVFGGFGKNCSLGLC